jgi:hypothetical protein
MTARRRSSISKYEAVGRNEGTRQEETIEDEGAENQEYRQQEKRKGGEGVGRRRRE